MFRSLLREPLLHFLVLGAVLFAFDAWRRPDTAPAAASEIVVSEARIRSLAQNFRRSWQRPPTPEELDGLIETHIREEVFYREALALGLDRDDTIVRRRLQQKMEFVSEQAAILAAPTDEELASFLAAHADAFRVEPRVTFTQVYLDPQLRAQTLAADAAALRDRLNGLDGAAGEDAGDPLLLLEPHYEDVAADELARLFGSEFAAAIMDLPAGRWAGPIASGYGVHVVRVEAMRPGGVPPLDEVRQLVEREWVYAKRQELNRAFEAKLRAKYAIKVQMPAEARR